MRKQEIIHEIEECIINRQYAQGRRLAEQAIVQMPKAPVFYNLMGVLLEKEYHHVQAVNYFRNAYELNPAYEPARYNLERYGIFYPISNCMYSNDE